MECKVISLGDINRESNKIVSSFPVSPKQAVDQWQQYLSEILSEGWQLSTIIEANGFPLAVFYRTKTRKSTTTKGTKQ